MGAVIANWYYSSNFDQFCQILINRDSWGETSCPTRLVFQKCDLSFGVGIIHE